MPDRGVSVGGRSWVRALGVALAALVTLAGPGEAVAGPEGEARSFTREPDRPYTVVAGDADASATVQNPANLGYLRGFNGILDFSASSPVAGRRGNGFGAFVAVPLPWQILALGVGVQAMWRPQLSSAVPVDPNEMASDALATVDDTYGKFSFGVALPLMRWAPGLSLGLHYSRLFSGTNAYVQGINQLDLGLSWRANRFVTLALVARSLNAPRLSEGGIRETPVLDPELALRPFGDPRLELALGARMRVADFDDFNDAESYYRGYPMVPRGRVLVGVGGFRVFLDAEMATYFQTSASIPTPGVRVGLGIQFDTPHVGVTAGTTWGYGLDGGTPIHGGTGRLRVSYERYDEVVSLRPRRVTRLSLAGKSSDRDLAETLAVVDEISRFRGGVILVEVSETGFATAQLEELRAALTRFKAGGGKVVIYLEGANLSHYFLASVGDRILAHPQSALAITGLRQRVLYWGDLLAKIGVHAEFVRAHEYKATPETFSGAGPSAPVAEAARVLLTDRWNHLVRMIGQARARDPSVVSSWVDEAPWQPGDARARGIVDGLAWPDELDEELEAWLGRELRIEPPPRAPTRSADWRSPAHIAVLHVDGDIVSGPSLHIPILDRDLAGSETLTREIARLREDPSVKAIVVRIDSRGGSVAASREIARELDQTVALKPVVISMGSVTASGGYYIATAGEYIYANATTTTGSIGVYVPQFDLSGLLDKVGVHAEIRTIGERAAMRSSFKPMSEDERAAAMAGVEATYGHFIERVAAARAMSLEEADELARGRVWSGARAIELGLVDRYGGLHEAVDRAARMANYTPAPGHTTVVLHYPEPPTLLERIRNLFGLSLPIPLGQAEGLGADPLAPLGRALGFAGPLVRVLGLLPAAMWYEPGVEAIATATYEVEIEG